MRSAKARDKRECPSCGVVITVPVNGPRTRFQCPRCLNTVTPAETETDAATGGRGESAAPPPATRPTDAGETSAAAGGDPAGQAESRPAADGTARELESLGRECAALRRELADAKCALTDAAKMIAGIVVLEQKITDLGWVCMTANAEQPESEGTAEVIR
jgi:predicted RNA-binding Zn-ribbon protein involved in translation (DUF1610 family)